MIEAERFEEALAPLARAIELKTDVAMFHNNLGMALECTGRFRHAENAYKSAVDINGAHEKAFANLVRIENVEQDVDVEPIEIICAAIGGLVSGYGGALPR